MARISVNIILAVALVIVVVMTYSLRRDFTQRNWEILPGMVFSVSYEAQSANPNFPNGKTLQVPPEGTIARGFLPIHYDATAEDALRAGRELKSPIDSLTREDKERGAFVYGTYCQPCHGSSGGGDGTVVQRGFPPPPSLFSEKPATMSDGQMYHAITYGVGNMPGFGSKISRDDRWRAIVYVRALQQRAAAATARVQ